MMWLENVVLNYKMQGPHSFFARHLKNNGSFLFANTAGARQIHTIFDWGGYEFVPDHVWATNL